MTKTDVLFVAWNRLQFTKFAFEKLLENTNWDLVNQLVVYDDGSVDDTKQWLRNRIKLIGHVPVDFRTTQFGSPVAVMDDYVGSSSAEWFAKVDNDIVMPPGWLDALVQVVEEDGTLDLLGCEAGRTMVPQASHNGLYWWEEARHIGGIGLMRVEAFASRRRMTANGRFGFTEWQHEFRPKAGWICPDLLLCSLDQVPMEPWASLAATYVEKGWAREWPKYHERWPYYWGWWAGPEAWTEYNRLTNGGEA